MTKTVCPKLYLDINNYLEQENNTDKRYNFKFLTEKEIAQNSDYWFEVGKILDWEGLSDINNFLKENGFDITKKTIQEKILTRLFYSIHNDKIINYYEEDEQSADQALEVFIRTNSGGTRLSFSDLLLSMSTANWGKLDAKKELNELIREINNSYQIILNSDFLLKTCLVLCINDIRFKLKNFTKENIESFEKNWERIRASIISGVELVYHLGHNNNTLTSKNAIIPIIYYIYKNNVENVIDPKNIEQIKNRKIIQKWLNISLIKRIFGGRSDNTLTKLRQIINDNPGTFPFNKIVSSFNGSNLDYSFTDEFIVEILKFQKDTIEAHNILSLLYPDQNYFERSYHIDHLHPKSRFENGEIAKAVGHDNEKVNDKNIWNSILNLQVLDGRVNSSKNSTPLGQWAKAHCVNNERLFVKDTTSLDEKDYLQFIADRREILTQKIKELVQI